jgi:hypothetical protein
MALQELNFSETPVKDVEPLKDFDGASEALFSVPCRSMGKSCGVFEVIDSRREWGCRSRSECGCRK